MLLADNKTRRLTAGAASPAIVQLPSSATLKVGLTTQHGTTGKRPHQAFLTLQDPASGLEESYAFGVKESGKAKLDIVRSPGPSDNTRMVEEHG